MSILRTAAAHALLAALIGCTGDEGCEQPYFADRLDVDVTALPGADEVCIGGECGPVESGHVVFGDQLDELGTVPVTIEKKQRFGDVVVLDRDGNELLAESRVRFPQLYAFGEACGSYATFGSLRIDANGDVTASSDLHDAPDE